MSGAKRQGPVCERTKALREALSFDPIRPPRRLCNPKRHQRFLSAMNWKQIVDAACELIWTVESVVMIYWWYTERKKKP